MKVLPDEEFQGGCNCESLVLKLFSLLNDDVRVGIIVILMNDGPLSLRSLARRLKVNHKKLSRNLRKLIVTNFIEEMQIKVSDNRVYKVYFIKPEIKEVLEKIIRNY